MPDLVTPGPGGSAAAQASRRADGWDDAALAAVLLAIDPHGVGGLSLRAAAGPVREAWLALLRSAWPVQAPWRRLPAQAGEDRVLGGLDLAATLQAGRPVAQRGLLAEADGGLLVVAMAERLPVGMAAHLNAALDRGEVIAAREGLSLHAPARLGVLALDEAASEDESVPLALAERLGLRVDLSDLSLGDVGGFRAADGEARADPDPLLQRDVQAARDRLQAVTCGAAELQALSGAALALGVASLRASWLALRVARAHAAWSGRDTVQADDASAAVRLVLAPRATRLPQAAPAPEDPSAQPDPVDPGADADPPAADPPAEAPAEPPPPPQQARSPDDPNSDPDPDPQADPDPSPTPTDVAALQDRLLEAAAAVLPPGVLARLAMAARSASPAGRGGAGGAGQARLGQRRGRPVGVRRAPPGRGARLSLIDTLRAAAPWQKLRRPVGQAPTRGVAPAAQRSPIQVREEDFHVRRYQQRSETTTVFVVDASGSAALRRLAEAKGAVELLLADCYVRRDSVALVSFRGTSAELLLPPTRSLVRARRSLAGLPGGGGTPLAAGLDAAFGVADAVRRRGDLPLLVVLTDGRANIDRRGQPGREAAEADALQSARVWRAAGLGALLVDLSARPHPSARALAEAMGAAYLPLPHADAHGLSQAVDGARRARSGAGSGG